MEIPTCNYTYNQQEFYVKSIKNNDYVPYVFGFVISISAIGLLTSIYNAYLEYKQELNNKIKIVLYISLILIFLGLLGYSGYKLGTYSTKNLTSSYTADKLIRPCYSKYSKIIYGSNMINQETTIGIYPNSGLKSYSNKSPTLINTSHSEKNIDQNTPLDIQNQLNTTQNTPSIKTISDPYNTRTSETTSNTTGTINVNDPNATGQINSTADSTSALGSNVQIQNNSAPPTSSIATTNVQQASQNSTGTQNQEISGTSGDGDSLIVRGS